MSFTSMSKWIINKELLISAVRGRPVLWDKNNEHYRDKGVRKMAWQEVFVILRKDFGTVDATERHEYGKFVIKTWSQLRDCWVRSLNDRKKGKMTRPYLYHRHLLFLKKVTKHESVVSDTEDDEPTNTESLTQQNDIEEIQTNEGRPKRKRTNERIQMIQIPDSPENDRHFAFFKSIQPTLSLLDDDQTLQFQSGVISLLQTIKSGNDYGEWYRPSSSSHSQSHQYLNPSPRNTPSVESDNSEDPFQETKFEISENSN